MKKLLSNEGLVSGPKKPSHEEISSLAHRLYEQAGRPEGKALEHWFNAESMTEANFGYGKSHTEHDFAAEDETNK